MVSEIVANGGKALALKADNRDASQIAAAIEKRSRISVVWIYWSNSVSASGMRPRWKRSHLPTWMRLWL